MYRARPPKTITRHPLQQHQNPAEREGKRDANMQEAKDFVPERAPLSSSPRRGLISESRIEKASVITHLFRSALCMVISLLVYRVQLYPRGTKLVNIVPPREN